MHEFINSKIETNAPGRSQKVEQCNQPPAANVTIIKTESNIPGVRSSTSIKRSCVDMIFAFLSS